MDRGAWRATVYGAAKRWTRLSDGRCISSLEPTSRHSRATWYKCLKYKATLATPKHTEGESRGP